jgi:hypothetical protein
MDARSELGPALSARLGDGDDGDASTVHGGGAAESEPLLREAADASDAANAACADAAAAAGLQAASGSSSPPRLRDPVC